MVVVFSTSAQSPLSIGVSGWYNFPVKTIGVGTRLDYRFSRRLAFDAQLHYAPPFNNITELYAGGFGQFYIIAPQAKKNFYTGNLTVKPSVYALAGVSYNRWINYYASLNPNAKKNNIIPKVGLGTSVNLSKVRLFMEVKYLPIFNESYGEIGVLFNLGKNKAKSGTECPRII